jgi:hypothetical protein
MARRPGHDGISTEAVAEPNELMMKGHIIVPLYFDNQFSEKPVLRPGEGRLINKQSPTTHYKSWRTSHWTPSAS